MNTTIAFDWNDEAHGAWRLEDMETEGAFARASSILGRTVKAPMTAPDLEPLARELSNAASLLFARAEAAFADDAAAAGALFIEGRAAEELAGEFASAGHWDTAAFDAELAYSDAIERVLELALEWDTAHPHALDAAACEFGVSATDRIRACADRGGLGEWWTVEFTDDVVTVEPHGTDGEREFTIRAVRGPAASTAFEALECHAFGTDCVYEEDLFSVADDLSRVDEDRLWRLCECADELFAGFHLIDWSRFAEFAETASEFAFDLCVHLLRDGQSAEDAVDAALAVARPALVSA